MITTADFQQNTKVSLRAPILSGKGWTFEGGDSRYTLGEADVIDLNGNGVDTFESGGFLVGHYSYNDPALTSTLEELRSLARSIKTEVLLSRDLVPGSLQIRDVSVEQKFFAREIHRNSRSLDQLARQQAPGCPHPEWAIDTVKGEFLVYDGATSTLPTPSPVVLSTPAPEPIVAPAPPVVRSTPAPEPQSTAEPEVQTAPAGASLLVGCALAMGSMVLASAIPGPSSLVVMAAGMLSGAVVAVKFS